MTTLISPQTQHLELRLARDLVRTIKRGHPWVYADALRQRPAAPAGTQATLLDNKKKRPIAKGFYDPSSPLAFRVCTVEPETRLDDDWAAERMQRAVSLRNILFDEQTTGFRLFNGEGDGLPGLICDVYHQTAVLQLDGEAPSKFWHASGVAEWAAKTLGLTGVYLKKQSRQAGEGRWLVGDRPGSEITFLENNIRFSVDVVKGQKTGFFLDQRDNRRTVGRLARDRRVLNVFGYTGGFSVYAGLGGAMRVTTVDTAAPALQAAERNWRLNGLPEAQHNTVSADAFDYLDRASRQKKEWDLVIVDPPSFAPTQETVKKAVTAYQNLVAAAANVTASDGLLAAASCSSHIDLPMFLAICEEGISRARRRATLLHISGQPADHPTPLPFSEFRYLKFVIMRVE